MALTNGKGRAPDDLIEMLHGYEHMMELMIKAGLTYHSFKEHSMRLYVHAAVKVSDGNYCEAARKIGLHRNNITRIMGTKKGSAYVSEKVERQGGEPD